MLAYLIILFIAMPIIELAILIKVGQFLGVFNTLSIVMGTGLAGALLARSQGLRVIKDIQNKLNSGLIPGEHLFDGLFIFCGGLLLLTPGLITDLIGFIFLVPYSRNLIKKWLKKKFTDLINEGRVINFTSSRF